MILLKKQKGNIALTLVLMVSTVLLLSGVTLILSSIDNNFITKDSSNHVYAIMRSYSCIEEGIFRIKNNTSYTGSYTLTFSDGSCSATISNDTTPTTKIITSTSSVKEFNYSEVRKVDSTQNPMVFVK